MENKAKKPNSVLKPFEVIIGEWQTEGSHPLVPGVILRGFASVDWIENGAFLRIQSHIEEPNFPDGIEILGSDDSAGKFFMLHFDEREVSRKCEVALTERGFKWWREDQKFSQRFELTISEDGNQIVSRGEMSRNGGEWEQDLSLTYRRVE